MTSLHPHSKIISLDIMNGPRSIVNTQELYFRVQDLGRIVACAGEECGGAPYYVGHYHSETKQLKSAFA